MKETHPPKAEDTTREYYLKNLGIVDLETNNWTWYVTGADRVAKITPLPHQQPAAIDSGDTTLNDNLYSSFYLYDLPIHIGIGNTRIVYTPTVQCPGYVFDTIDYAADYYPYGKTLRKYTNGPEEKFLTTQHERDAETGLDYRGARFYDADVARFLSLDPHASNYPALSAYSYVAGNPMAFTDPSGKDVESTIVTDNGDGTYKVVGGNTKDGNNGVYVVELEDGEYRLTGDIIGTTLTYDSFYNYDEGKWYGTINLNVNDPNADDGRAFLKDEIIDAKLGLWDYISRAKGGEELDFKARGLKDQNITDDFTKVDYYYRGYSIGQETHFGAVTLPVIASARDIGNYAAGYVAGSNGVPWSIARYAFDGLESYQKGKLATEGQGTQAAQQKGHRDGWFSRFRRNPSTWFTKKL